MPPPHIPKLAAALWYGELATMPYVQILISIECSIPTRELQVVMYCLAADSPSQR